MKKILIGFLGIIFVISATAASGYALFSANANVDNIAFTTGTAGLQFSADNNTYSDSYTYSSWFEQNVYPGYDHTTVVDLKNNSSSNISLAISAQLTSATGDWGALASVARVKINGVDGSLADWNSGVSSINLTLNPGQAAGINVEFYIPTSAGNEISGKQLSTNWVFTGTQQ